MVAIKADAVSTAIVGDPTHIFSTVLLQNTVGLARSRITIDIVDFNRTIFFQILFLQQRIAEFINILDFEGVAGFFANDFDIAHALFHTVHNRVHGWGIFLCRRRDFTKLEKGSLYRGLCLLCVGPFPQFGNIVPIFRRCSKCLFNMSRRKSVFNGTKPNR